MGAPLCDLRVAEGTELHGASIAEAAPQTQDSATAAAAGSQFSEPAALSSPAIAVSGPPSAASSGGGIGEMGYIAAACVVPGDSPPAAPGKALASPAVRRIARELGVDDLAAVRGSGHDGRVVRGELIPYIYT